LRVEPFLADLPQLLSHSAVLLRVLAVASCEFPKFLARPRAVLGRVIDHLCGSVLAVCGIGQAYDRRVQPLGY
jgi:hypothetical protein